MEMLIRVGGKRGLSEIVAYVMLISITIALSVLVYGWLKFYANSGDSVKCPDNVAILIKSVDCSGKTFNLTLQNKGYFSVDGYVLKIDNRIDAKRGIYSLDTIGAPIEPGNETILAYDFSSYNTLTFVEVQPFIITKQGKVFCENVASQAVSC